MQKPLKFDGTMFTVRDVNFLSDKRIVMSIQDFKKTKPEAFIKACFYCNFLKKGI
jgi:hypothetical protein